MDSNSDLKPPARRKVKYAPKAPPKRVPKIEVKSELVEEDNKASAAEAKELLRRFHENERKARMKVEKKVSASQIAFGSGGQSAHHKPYGIGSKTNGIESSAFVDANGKEYKEPWDLYSDYPIALPLRKPYSGNPEYLDKEEFGEAAESRTYDENAANSAAELGLLEENPETKSIFMRLPPVFPMIKKPDADVKVNSKRPAKLFKFDEMPPGLIGKMIVYKSGKVKLKIGNTLYDVSSGMNCIFSQELVAMNAAEKHCSSIGEISKLATVTPDVDAALDCLSDLDL
ncbi:uncharacterized protein LOC127093092 [Lathyrus oleraceus]|uniref:DNA-directed RNA polymerase III subunit RPC4 n=1 Tax=Pisum sativum TaxID=3888 RepID=A0A9D5A7W3_PEA|nr:uncharacterized protein LOC127093092 [Pisum sativum]KAI5398256.1 hypothetical protein KIW84_063884 [Pisum sativum]